MNSIVFCGDIVLPFDSKVNYTEVITCFEHKAVIANLEGAILTEKDQLNLYKWDDKYSVYSCPSVIKVLKDFGVKYVSLCNNHILDYNISLSFTNKLLEQNGIDSFGSNNEDILKTELNGKPLYVITFSTCVNGHALRLYNPDRIVNTIKELKLVEDCYVVLFPHWGIERLPYVEPADREHAHRCIDAGADLIVGHHPHIIQQVEEYKGRTIVYSVGNFIFPQTFYGKKKLVFDNPAIQDELVVEWDGDNVKFHTMHFDRETNTLSLLRDKDKYLNHISENVTDEEYKYFFKNIVSLRTYYLSRRYSDSNQGELFCYYRNLIIRHIRRVLIKTGFHTPK